jgi:hypothetical protein
MSAKASNQLHGPFAQFCNQIAFCVLSGFLLTPAAAQDPSQYANLATAYESAQRDAIRNGDEKLDCPALEQQLIEAVTTPAVLDYIAKSGEQAQRDSKQVKPDPTKMTAQAALAAFSSLAPGGAWVGMSAAAAQTQGMQAQTAQNIEQRMRQANEMVTILPQLLRGQRVIELAQTRKCDWVPADVMK